MSAASVRANAPGSPPVAHASDALDERRHLASRVLTDALLLGIVGDALLREAPWGANMTAWCIAIVAAVFTLARRRYDAVPSDARWLAIPAIALATMYAWRDADSLAAYNTLALLVTFALLATAVARGPGATVLETRVRDVIEQGATIGVGTLLGMLPLVLSDVSLRHVAHARGATRAIAILRATLIAIPLLLVFGGLFASADPVFARIAANVFRVDAEVIASHLIIGGLMSWLAGGFLRASVLSSGQQVWSDRVPDGALGLTEVATALGSLVVLFAAFVAVQVRYFFGGHSLVQATAGLSYAEYARHGFFELVAVSVLVLPVLLVANALLRRDTPRATTVYRALAGTLLGLLGIIMYSAIARMRLYQSVYGMSVDRLYATVFMAWLAVVFVWLAATVLRGRGERFVAGVLISGWSALIALNVANPVAYVANANVARAASGTELDVSYIQSLGADAAPALTAYLVRQPVTAPSDYVVPLAGLRRSSSGPAWARDGYTARCEAARRLVGSFGANVTRDWRGWTLGKSRALHAVRANETALRTLAGDMSAPCAIPPSQGN